jgi:hypothetical protein
LDVLKGYVFPPSIEYKYAVGVGEDEVNETDNERFIGETEKLEGALPTVILATLELPKVFLAINDIV